MLKRKVWRWVGKDRIEATEESYLKYPTTKDTFKRWCFKKFLLPEDFTYFRIEGTQEYLFARTSTLTSVQKYDIFRNFDISQTGTLTP